MDPLFGRVLGAKRQTYEVTIKDCTCSISGGYVVAYNLGQQAQTHETVARRQRPVPYKHGSWLVSSGVCTLERSLCLPTQRQTESPMV